MAYDFDYFVIGGGSGGVRSANVAAKNGARVGIAEGWDLGGTCVNRGCVPKKFMVFAGQYGKALAEAASYGWRGAAHDGFDWPTLRDTINRTVQTISGKYESGLNGNKVTIYKGMAKLTGPHAVEVNGTTITAEKILIAVGGKPRKPTMPGGEHAILSDDVFHLEAFPKKLVVAGGGYIALEFASIFNALGSDVTVIYRGAEVLKEFDHDLRHMLAEEMAEAGIKFHLHCTIPQIEKNRDGVVVSLSNGQKITANQVLFAIGRVPLTDQLGLASVGIKTRDSGAIIVDENYQTSVPSIYAVGDVTDRWNLTPVAIREGHWLADHLFGRAKNKIDYPYVTTAVFTTPELGAVGLTEEQAVKQGFDVAIFRTRFRAMKYVITPSDSYSMMKLIVDRKTDRVLGAHMLGEGAGEIIQSLAVAITMGATKADIDRTVALHPTVAEEFVTMREPAASTLKPSQAAE